MEYVNEHPGRRIKAQMKRYNLTVRKLAEAMDVDAAVVSRLINGHASITPRLAVKLNGALDMGPYYWAELQMRHDVEKAIEEAKQ